MTERNDISHPLHLARHELYRLPSRDMVIPSFLCQIYSARSPLIGAGSLQCVLCLRRLPSLEHQACRVEIYPQDFACTLRLLVNSLAWSDYDGLSQQLQLKPCSVVLLTIHSLPTNAFTDCASFIYSTKMPRGLGAATTPNRYACS